MTAQEELWDRIDREFGAYASSKNLGDIVEVIQDGTPMRRHLLPSDMTFLRNVTGLSKSALRVHKYGLMR